MLETNLSLTNNQDDVPCTTHSVADAETIRLWRYWLEGVLQLMFSFLGLLTNSLSIFILTRKSLAFKTFNQLLTSLAIFDSIFLLIMFYESLGVSFELNFREWYYMKALLTPYFLYPMKAISMTGSVYMMVAVAVERHIAVYLPFSRIPDIARHGSSNPNRNKKIRFQFLVYLLLVLLISIFLNITKFLESTFIPNPPFIQITQLRLNYTYLFVFSCVRLFFLGIAPLVVVSILNYNINKTVHKSSRRGNKDDTLTAVLTCIVLIFILCSLPRLIILMYEVSMMANIKYCANERRLFPFWNHILGFISHNLLALNPFLNFLVYCVVGRTFRRVVASYLGRLGHCGSSSLSRSSGTLNRRIAMGSRFDRRESNLTWSAVGPQDSSRRQSYAVGPQDSGRRQSYAKCVNMVGLTEGSPGQVHGSLSWEEECPGRVEGSPGRRRVLGDVKEDYEGEEEHAPVEQINTSKLIN